VRELFPYALCFFVYESAQLLNFSIVAAACERVLCENGGVCDAASGRCQCKGGWQNVKLTSCTEPLRSESSTFVSLRLQHRWSGPFDGVFVVDDSCSRSSCCCLVGLVSIRVSGARDKLLLYATYVPLDRFAWLG
jgi:hypothetical protein